MPDALVLVGLTIGVVLSAFIVRRRQRLRAVRRQLASRTALAKVSQAARRPTNGGAPPSAVELKAQEEPPGRRSNRERRMPDRRRGRGRRKGGDRRGQGSPKRSGGAPPSP